MVRLLRKRFLKSLNILSAPSETCEWFSISLNRKSFNFEMSWDVCTNRFSCRNPTFGWTENSKDAWKWGGSEHTLAVTTTLRKNPCKGFRLSAYTVRCISHLDLNFFYRYKMMGGTRIVSPWHSKSPWLLSKAVRGHYRKCCYVLWGQKPIFTDPLVSTNKSYNTCVTGQWLKSMNFTKGSYNKLAA